MTTSKILARTLLSVVVLAVISVLVLIAALGSGPLPLTFLTPYIDQIVAEQYPEIQFEFGELALLWDGHDKNLVVGVRDMSIRKDLETVASIPAVAVTFSGEALLQGRLAPSGLEFTGLKVVLTRSEDGAVRLGYSYAAETENTEALDVATSATPQAIHELLAGLGQKAGSSDLTAYLKRLELYQFSLFVNDQKTDKLWRLTSADLVAWNSEEAVNARLQGDAQIGGEMVNLVFDATYDRSSKDTAISTSLTDFPLPIIARELPGLEILKGISLPVSGKINLSLDPQFKPGQINFKLAAGAGKVDLPSLYKKPLSIKSVELEGHSAAPFTSVNLNVVKIASKGPQITLSGTFENTDKGFGMSIKGASSQIMGNDIGTYWPYSAAVDAYQWVSTKISNGSATDIQFRIDLPAGVMKSGKLPEGAIELTFKFSGVSADYFPPLPKVTNISGQAVLTEKQIHLFDLAGEVQGVAVPTGDVLLYDFDQYDQIADITLSVSGESRKIFEFLDKKPLGFADPFGIDPEQMTGIGAVDVQFVFPLRNDLTLEKLDFEAKGKFENAFIPNVYDGFDLSDADMAVLVTPEKLTVKGVGKVKSTFADILFQSWFKGARQGERRYEVVAKLDDKARVDLGLVNTEYLKGPVGASLTVNLKENEAASGVVTLNLLETVLEAPELKFSKPAGGTGLFGAQFKSDGKGNTRLSNIRLSSENVNLVGNALVDSDGLKNFTASRLVFAENNLELDVARTAKNSYRINVRGQKVDLRPYILDDSGPSEVVEEPPLDPDAPSLLVNLQIDEALLDAGVTLNTVSGYVVYGGERLQRSEITANLAEKYPVKFVLASAGAGRRMDFTSEEASLLLKGLDIYDNSRDGTILVTAAFDDSTRKTVLSGRVKISDLRVVNAPVLGKILTIGSLTGIVELLQNDGMTFAKIEGPFTYNDGVLSTKDFRAVGAIGLTFTGKVDENKDIVDGFGTVIPSYTLNSILGNIPILGQLLVGRRGEGIFGFSYKLKGKAEDPKISVNPVSALAPGILRRMFFEPWPDTTTDKPSKQDDADAGQVK